MLGKNWKYSLVLLVTLALVVIAEWSSPKPLNWTPSFTRQDKIPFGSHIVYNLLPELFSGQPIQNNNVTIYEFDQASPNEARAFPSDSSLRNYLFITDEFGPGQEDTDVLLKWVAEGNHVFIATEQLSGALSDTLKVETKSVYKGIQSTLQANFVNPALRNEHNYSFTHVSEGVYFSQVDTPRTTILGVDSLRRPNFIRISRGKGYFYLSTIPKAFTNYHMLYQNNAEYVAKSLSYLPVRPLVWDEHYKPGTGEQQQSPLRFFVQHEALRWALYLSLAGLALFMIFEAKRRQRIIPVIPPLSNTTLEFTETVGRLYYQHKDHKNIAEKKIAYLLDYIRSRFYLSTDVRDKPFYLALSQKTGIDQPALIRLFEVIDNVRRQTIIAEVELLELNQELENFYAQTG